MVYRPWHERSIRHGMTLIDSNYPDAEIESSIRPLLNNLEVAGVLIPRQTHGDNVVVVDSEDEWSERFEEQRLLRSDAADAVVASPASSRRYGIGIRTADCVPILIEGITTEGRALWGAVHAGWRGLACGVIAAACRKIKERGTLIEAALFACGGGGVYEVGEEVLQAIGDSAVYSRKDSGKALLDLGATAARQLEKFLPTQKIGVAEMCTISSKEKTDSGTEKQLFHSFRRDGDRSGRSVTFVVLEA